MDQFNKYAWKDLDLYDTDDSVGVHRHAIAQVTGTDILTRHDHGTHVRWASWSTEELADPEHPSHKEVTLYYKELGMRMFEWETCGNSSTLCFLLGTGKKA